jgi:8-oxo-dGTP diphosphatase
MKERGPRVVASVLVKKDGRFLLLKQRLKGGETKWLVPGGGVKFGEGIEEAAVREIWEETNLKVRITRFLGFNEAKFTEKDYHTVIFFYLGEPVGGELKLLDDAAHDMAYFTKDEAKELDLISSARWLFEERLQ